MTPYNPLAGGRRSNFSQEPHEETGPNCPEHGVPLFLNCPQCSAPWPVIRPGTPGKRPGAENFCKQCTQPAPWLTRAQRIAWVGHQLQADLTIPGETRDELLAVVERLQAMEPGDTRAVSGWKAIRARASAKVWETIKPVLQTLAGEGLKKALGL